MKITIDADLLENLIEKYSGINSCGLSMNVTFLEELKSLKVEAYKSILEPHFYDVSAFRYSKINPSILRHVIENAPSLNHLLSKNKVSISEIKTIAENTPNKLNNEIEDKGKIYIRLLKSGGYRSKDGTIKKPIFIKGIPYAPKDDIK